MDVFKGYGSGAVDYIIVLQSARRCKTILLANKLKEAKIKQTINKLEG
jgi:hypothetical protein